ncbi:MAG TPA: hypothetical protein DGG94_01270, partial [Micromonosporaceae bacterium]|nr:hypothetical protein [Micromonosporaceae bacterium]
MKPHPGAFDVPIQTDDKFEVPVMVRWTSPLDPPRRPFQADIDGAKGNLPMGELPGAGRYMVGTTWREVLHA